MQESSASKKSNSGESVDEELKSIDDSLLNDIQGFRTRLKEISDELSTSKMIKGGTFRITGDTVQDFIVDIDKIYSFFKSNQTKIDDLGNIQDTQKICDLLDDGMSKLNEALLAWSDTQSGGWSINERLQVKGEYQNRLRECRKLIEEALTFFLEVEQNP